MVIKFMSDTSGVKTMVLGLNTLGRAESLSLSAVCPGKLSLDLF